MPKECEYPLYSQILERENEELRHLLSKCQEELDIWKPEWVHFNKMIPQADERYAKTIISKLVLPCGSSIAHIVKSVLTTVSPVDDKLVVSSEYITFEGYFLNNICISDSSYENVAHRIMNKLTTPSRNWKATHG